MTYNNRAAIKWIFNHLMALLVMNHLKNWLIISEEATRERWVYTRVPFGLKNMPFFAVFPQNRSEPLELREFYLIKMPHISWGIH